MAQIGSLPAAQGGVVGVCAGDSVMFQSTSTNVGLITTYEWDFGPFATPQTATGAGPHMVSFSGATQSTSVSLTVDNQNGLGSDAVSQPVVVNEVPQSQLELVLSGAGYSVSNDEEVEVFRKCNSSDSAVFSWNITDGVDWEHSFQWGDDTPDGNEAMMAGGQLSHAYAIGQFDLVHTIETPAGCSTSQDYIVFNGSAPLITVEGQGLTTCLPFPYNIQILSNDVPIDYVVSFSDGTPSDVFSSSSDTTLAHVFESSSCGVDYTYAPSFPPIQNAFSATLVAQNLCSVGGFPTIFTIGPITISTPAQAEIEQTTPNPVCVNSTADLVDVSSPPANISSQGCDSTASRVWVLPQGASVETGEAGSFNGYFGEDYDFTLWSEGSEALELSFDAPGSYVLGLYVGSNCGVDSTTHVVEVKPAATLSISSSMQTICSGDSTEVVLLTSSESDYEVVWSIDDYDGVAPVFPSSGSGEGMVVIPNWTPENLGNEDGTFLVSAQVDCSNDDPVTHLVTVGPEALILADPTSTTVCSGEGFTVDFESNVDNASFTWVFAPNPVIAGASGGTGSALQQSLTNSASSIEIITYTVSVGGVACPGDDLELEVEVLPAFELSDLDDQSGCPGTVFGAVEVEPVEGGIWSWEVDNSVGLAASGEGNVPAFTASANPGDSPLVANVTITGQVNDCPSDETTYQITIFNLPSASFETVPNGGLHCVTGEAEIAGMTAAENSMTWSGPGVLEEVGNAGVLVNEVGDYSVEVLSGITGCVAEYTVEVVAPEAIAIAQVDVVGVSCYGADDGAISLVATASASDLVWEWTPPVSSGNAASDLVSGSYNILVENASFCTDEVDVSVLQPEALEVSLVDSIASECGESNGLLEVTAIGGTPGYFYQWDGHPSGAVVSGIDAGSYSVVVEDQMGCTVQGEWALGCIPLLEVVPNEFLSPNEDNRNDRWVVDHILLYPENEVWVYNRWGNLVHHAAPYMNEWDGRFTEGRRVGEVLPSATYYYVIDTKKKSQRPFQGFLEIQSQQQ